MEWIQIYDEAVSQYAYIIGCEETRQAIIFDPQRIIDDYLSVAEEKNLEIVAVAETHIHADFLSGTREFLQRTDAKAYLSDHGRDEGWAYEWVAPGDKVAFIKGGDRFKIGTIEIEVVHTPGHTPEHVVYLVHEPQTALPLGAVTGDFVFAGDLGRPDLLETAAKAKGAMEKGAKSLYQTVEKFRQQPDSLLIWPGHGAGSACGKNLGRMPHSSWGYELATSDALQKTNEQEFSDFITSAQTEPPLYFARMKKLNKEGVPLLGPFAPITEIEVAELDIYIEESDTLIIDTRADRSEAMAKHLSGALYVPFTAMFSTAIGSVVEDPGKGIVLIIAPEQAQEARRRLANIGYDRVLGFITPDALTSYDEEDHISPIPVTDFSALEKVANDTQVIDVRSAAEFEESHLPGAINAPYTRLPEFEERIPKDKRLLVHCGSGARASVATTWLAGRGYDATLINDRFKNAKVCAI